MKKAKSFYERRDGAILDEMMREKWLTSVAKGE
jgi:hypothetical protein